MENGKLSIEDRFSSYTKPTDITKPKYDAIQKKTLELAVLIENECPESMEKQHALTLLKDAKMNANAAIAIHSRGYDENFQD